LEFTRLPKYIRRTTFVNLKTGGLRPVIDTHLMAVLTFTLSPEAVGKMHDALICLGKFNESVSLEATRDHVSSLKVKSVSL
jgi:hypothetical protein